MAYLYRHIRLDIQQPFYIGVSNDYKKKMNRARCTLKRTDEWKEIANKAGFEVEILMDGLTMEQAYEKEIEFIKLYGRMVDGGTLVNLSTGGVGGAGLDGKLNGMYGRKHSEAALKIMRSGIRKVTGMYGKYGISSKSIPVLQIDKVSGEVVAEYPSCNHAGRVNGWNSSCINQTAQGKGGMKSAYGYFWKIKT